MRNERENQMKCVFCSREYEVGTIVCSFCNEYKGMEEIEPKPFTTLGSALDEAMRLMEEAREAYADECEHENLHHTDSSAHLAFCPDCELEIKCECEDN